MDASESPPLAEFRADALRVVVHEDRAALGRAAAVAVARAIAARQAESRLARVIFAAAPSQDEFLAALLADGRVDWSRVVGLHMDEYLGLAGDHPASFRRYLRDRLCRPAGLLESQLRPIPGEEVDRPLRTALAYEEILRREPPDLVCGGIGENGHLAFNDPPVADFLDPVLVKVVRLDLLCRRQQVADGCFARIEDVPTHAYTLTIPALLAAPVVSLAVPGPRKAEAAFATVRGPVPIGQAEVAVTRHRAAVAADLAALAGARLAPVSASAACALAGRVIEANRAQVSSCRIIGCHGGGASLQVVVAVPVPAILGNTGLGDASAVSRAGPPSCDSAGLGAGPRVEARIERTRIRGVASHTRDDRPDGRASRATSRADSPRRSLFRGRCGRGRGSSPGRHRVGPDTARPTSQFRQAVEVRPRR